jgi:hypothetical protein
LLFNRVWRTAQTCATTKSAEIAARSSPGKICSIYQRR